MTDIWLNYKWYNPLSDNRTLTKRLECSLMARETWVQSQVESYQRLKKWYLMPPCLKLSIIRYGSRLKWNSSGKGVAPSPTPWNSSYRKGSLRNVTIQSTALLRSARLLSRVLDTRVDLLLHKPKLVRKTSKVLDHNTGEKSWFTEMVII